MVKANGFPTRPWLAVAVGVGTLAAVALGALLTGPTGGRVVTAAESVSASASSALQGVGAILPLGYAFGAGMVAAVNPCGFSLLPAYLGLYLGDRRQVARSSRARRAIVVSATVTVSFVLLFGTAGLLISATSSAVGLIFPWLGLLVGVMLIATGSYLVAGGSVYSGFGDRMAQRLGGLASRPGLIGYAAYGFAYGLASLGCTLPIFLTVVGGGQVSSRFWIMALQFVLYGLGLGVVLSALTLAAMLFDFGFLRNVRSLGRYLPLVSALLLLITGAYVSYYWLTAGGLLERAVSIG
jgi:cytochrome c-type biogenesis protein